MNAYIAERLGVAGSDLFDAARAHPYICKNPKAATHFLLRLTVSDLTEEQHSRVNRMLATFAANCSNMSLTEWTMDVTSTGRVDGIGKLSTILIGAAEGMAKRVAALELHRTDLDMRVGPLAVTASAVAITLPFERDVPDVLRTDVVEQTTYQKLKGDRCIYTQAMTYSGPTFASVDAQNRQQCAPKRSVTIEVCLGEDGSHDVSRLLFKLADIKQCLGVSERESLCLK